MVSSLIAVVLLFSLHSDAAQPLTADQIMQRVAVNQDSSEALRRQYVYKQHIHIASRKTNGKLMRDEIADYDVFPSEHGSSKKITQLSGKFWNKQDYVGYTGEPVPNEESIDGSIVTDFRNDLANEKQSKDGLAVNLFPLNSKQQANYRFKLLGEQTLNGRAVYRVRFEPKEKSDVVWSGEAFIDKQDFQPVTVFTKLGRKVPFVIRTALGTDLPGLGFSVTYKRQPDGVWFPATFGTEFRLRAVFFINRDISVSLVNSDFERTHVDSSVRFAAAQ
ncbi:MAG: hypothetical protein JO065_10830 [Acidobacteria bacterium]|nr:hypothetical protein [Acidobacteriota bacterium]